MSGQVRYQIVATGEQYGSRYGSQRYDIGAESEELATAEARRAYRKRTGLDNCDITIEVVGLLDADGHDVSRRGRRKVRMTAGQLREALAEVNQEAEVLLTGAGWLTAVRPDTGAVTVDLLTGEEEAGD